MAGNYWVVMYEIKATSYQSLEVKQSKFLAYLVPFHLLDTNLFQLKKDNPKARHFIVASRYLNEFSQVVEQSTDDGEPKGTSGRPVLNVLRGHNLMNVALIVVRYFGGTKLGTGGLVRAYTNAAKAVIDQAELLPFAMLHTRSFTVNYRDHQKVEHWLAQEAITVNQTEFINEGASFTVKVTREQEEGLENYAKSQRLINLS